MPAHDASRWAEAKAVLMKLLDVPPAEREKRARQICGTDDELLAMVLEYLAASGDATDTAESRIWRLAGPFAGQKLGPYQIHWRLAEQGGFGDVYLATRTRPFRRVAVKFLRPDRDDDEFRRRFQAEMQMLAVLQHSSIVQFVEAGSPRAPHPYFIMEYVEGLPIDRHCARARLSLRGRLEVFLLLLDAVQYTHRHLLVHRDLKPSNVLVTAEGQVKLLDFGIAKLLRPEIYGQEPLTGPAERVVSPEYASPEQWSGHPVTTAADVYSLGALLHLLLSGRPPFSAEGRTHQQMREAVVTQEPAPPSSSLGGDDAASFGEPDLRAWRGRLRGELDHIVLKALRKEPERRYQTVAEMAEDIRRYLRGDIVHARPSDWSYRVAKGLRRHWRAVATVALVIVSLAAALAVSIRSRTQTMDLNRLLQRKNAESEQRLGQVRNLAAGLRAGLDRRAAAVRQTPQEKRLRVQELRLLMRAYAGVPDYDALARTRAEALALLRELRDFEGIDALHQAYALRGAASREAETVAERARRTIQLAEDFETLAKVLRLGGDEAGARSSLERALALYRDASIPPSDPHAATAITRLCSELDASCRTRPAPPRTAPIR